MESFASRTGRSKSGVKVMRKVKNKKLIRRLSLRNLKAEKKKNSIAVLGIMLTCILFTSLFSIGGSILKTSQENTMRQVGGSTMAGLKYVLPQDVKKLSGDSTVKDPSCRTLIGEAMNPELKNLLVEVNCAEDLNAKNMFSYPEVGRMPKKRLEAATSTLVLDALGIPHKIGQKIRLSFDSDGRERSETFTLCGYWEGDPINMAQEFWLSRVYCDEIAPTPKQSYRDAGGMKTAGYWMMDFNFANSWNIEKQTKELLARNGYDVDHTDYGINWAYTTDQVDASTILLAAAILLIVLISGYLIIYNVFYISVTKDLQYYGLLKTVGTTGRQLKRLVRLQGCFLALYGIPLGLILGTALSRALLPIILVTLDMGNVVFSLHPLIYILAAAFSFITVLMSCTKPCRMAAKVSPVEAVNYTEQLPVKKKRGKTRKTSSTSMALRNLGRNRKKAVVVVCSLCLSLLLVNGTFTVTKGFDFDKYIGDQMKGDILIGEAGMITGNRNVILLDAITKKDREIFHSIEGVKAASDVYCAFGDIAMGKQGQDKVMKLIADNPQIFNEDPWMEEEVKSATEHKSLSCTLYGMDEYGISQLSARRGAIDWEAFQSGDYVLMERLVGNNAGNMVETDYCGAGDKVTLNLPDGKQKTYKVMALIDDIPTAMTNRMGNSLGTVVVLPENEYLAHAETKGALLSILTVSDSKAEAAEQIVKNYTERENTALIYKSKQDYKDEFNDFIRMYHVVGAALGAILGLIGILNFASVMVTGIFARKQEFAMMQAVGMSSRQLKKTLIWEGLLYALLTLAVTLTLGSAFCWLLIQVIAGEVWFFTYHFSVAPILICALPLLLITWLVPDLAYRSLKKKTVVEQLRVSY